MVVVHRVVTSDSHFLSLPDSHLTLVIYGDEDQGGSMHICIYGDGDDDVDRDWTCSELPLYQDTKFQILMIFRCYKV